MAKKNEIIVKDVSIKTMAINGVDYICITDIAKQKNAAEPKDVVKNGMRQKNTLEYLGLWEKLNNPNFKGVEFDPLLAEAGAAQDFILTPGRYVGVAERAQDGESFPDKMERLTAQLSDLLTEGYRLDDEIRKQLSSIGFGMD